MPVDAIIRLNRVLCHAESDGTGHSEPYVWTLLIWVDDTTLATPQLVGVSAPGNVTGSRAVIKEGMKAGERASLPSVQRAFAHRFEDDLDRRTIGLVVAMLEWDETPADAVRAACSAFVRELPRALARFISTHLRGPENDREEQEIADEVSPKVRAAGEDALSNWEKIRVALGTLDLDDEIGFDSWFTTVEQGSEPEDFRLSFENDSNHYEIEGRFELREPPAPDPCQAQVDRVSRAAAAVNGLESTIRTLQAELRQAPRDRSQGSSARSAGSGLRSSRPR